ncbi:hypothetical protein [Acuticoccus sp. I52.16.1]|uniref:hypothetical protein n=1 Tax=Acuticoccus sp. I52.16.1 TaxID=2928472 RepID=UPI001FD2D6B4|nr:hypothetical protein [Acuticoccus sp. I52.16.1]UOM35455.1 hypothetical protein MRB58_04400 [Acuticoccus sp. I52.16.1]
MRRVLVLALSLATACAAVPVSAADGGDTDWPCVQRKVPALTPAAVWTGPSLDAAGADWRDDPEVADMVRRLSQRRSALEEAEAEIDTFAAGLEPDESRRLILLFAGLFETMNAERGEIIEGIERYARRQRQVAQQVRTMASEFGALRRDPAADPDAVARAQTQLEWQTRIFNERRASLPYVCEVPRFVEQRLFALGRAIAGAMPD